MGGVKILWRSRKSRKSYLDFATLVFFFHSHYRYIIYLSQGLESEREELRPKNELWSQKKDLFLMRPENFLRPRPDLRNH